MITRRDLQKGIGLLEIMLSLMILSVLMLSILSYYRISNNAQKVSHAVQMIGGLIVASEDWLSTHHSFTKVASLQGKELSISIRTLVEQGKLPQSFCTNQDCTENNANPWGGAITLSPKDSRHVEIVLSGLPGDSAGKGICQQMSDLLKDKVSSDCSKSLEGEYKATYPES